MYTLTLLFSDMCGINKCDLEFDVESLVKVKSNDKLNLLHIKLPISVIVINTPSLVL